jgi:hypothetical protein
VLDVLGADELLDGTELLDDDELDDELLDDDGGSVGGCVVFGRSCVVGDSVSCTVDCGASAGPATFLARSGSLLGFPDTVITTVAVVPSGAMLNDVDVLTVSSTSAFGAGGPASGPEPVASMEAAVANTVATSTPPAASRTTEEAFFSGDSE